MSILTCLELFFENMMREFQWYSASDIFIFQIKICRFPKNTLYLLQIYKYIMMYDE